MKKIQLVIIGGGIAGLASACAAYENGVRDILILERDEALGGILQQCIHNGFGLHSFNEELAGPAFAQRYIDKIINYKIEYKIHSMVTHLSSNRIIEYVNTEEGYIQIEAEAIILCMGCRERTRGAITIPGYRPAGIWSAGTAQRYLNMDGYQVGKKIFILGSGDIGLIMARRLTLEGAKVVALAEIMPYSNGLARNMKQCLEDFNIPLYLSHTITKIDGKDRVNAVEISQVDDCLKPIPNTIKRFEVDTILFSVGLIPENNLSEEANIILDSQTKGPYVDESYQSSIQGIFAAGNVLHVHDIVDFVAQEAEKAGIAAAHYLNNQLENTHCIYTKAYGGIAYIVPQKIYPVNVKPYLELKFRVKKPKKDIDLIIRADGQIIKKMYKTHLNPSEMEKVILLREDLLKIQNELSIEINEVKHEN